MTQASELIYDTEKRSRKERERQGRRGCSVRTRRYVEKSVFFSLMIGTFCVLIAGACTRKPGKSQEVAKPAFSMQGRDLIGFTLVHRLMQSKSSTPPKINVCIVSHSIDSTDAKFVAEVSKAAKENLSLAVGWWTKLATESPKWPYKEALEVAYFEGTDCKKDAIDLELNVFPEEDLFEKATKREVSHYWTIDKKMNINTYDVFEAKIVAHEFGHALGLLDLYEPALTENKPQPDALMNNTVWNASGPVFRQDDRSGLLALIDAVAAGSHGLCKVRLALGVTCRSASA